MRVDVLEDKSTLASVLLEYDRIAFTGGHFGKALRILEQMVKERKNLSVFLALSGALVPAGLQAHIVRLLRTGLVSGVVTTGATLTHDYLEALGHKHTFLDMHGHDDAELRKAGVNRILDVGATNEAFEAMEVHLHKWMESQYPKKPEGWVESTPEFLRKLGSDLSEKSILGVAARNNIPLYCPAIMDSMLGVHCMTYAEYNKFKLDPIAELKEYLSQCFDSGRTGAIILGGGVSKNYLFQGMLVSGKELSYAIQVTMDRPEHGGLSGATLDEAISWGKIDPHAMHSSVIADVTLVFPLVVRYVENLVGDA